MSRTLLARIVALLAVIALGATTSACSCQQDANGRSCQGGWYGGVGGGIGW